MSDKLFKLFLVLVAFYFLIHIGSAFAQYSPTVPTIQCWNNGFGTIQCTQI